MNTNKIEGIFEHCYGCRRVTPQNKIVENKKTYYVCCVCGNKKRRTKGDSRKNG